MQRADITVSVYIDAKTFLSFALFDSFVRQRRWRPLAIFSGILLASGIICYLMIGKAEQAALLGSVLTLVALGIPAVYFFSFLSSVRQQSEIMRLSTPRYAYTLTFGADDGITVKAGKEQQIVQWEDVFSVYRVRHAIYLFASQQKAYLLPDNQIEGGADCLWLLLKSKMPANRLFDKRGRRRPHS